MSETNKEGRSSKKQLSKIETQTISTLPTFINFEDLGSLTKAAEIFAKSKLSPLKTEEDVINALLVGNSIGIDPIMAVGGGIMNIEGNTSLSVHIYSALALKHGLTETVLEDCEPYHALYLRDQKNPKDESKMINVGEIPAKNRKDIDRDKYAFHSDPHDWKTKIEFERMIKLPNGEWKTVKAHGQFSYTEAVQANLVKKNNWKYLRAMLYARAKTAGMRRCGSDITHGCYEHSEIHPNNVVFTEDGNSHIVVEDQEAKIVEPTETTPVESEVIEPEVIDLSKEEADNGKVKTTTAKKAGVKK